MTLMQKRVIILVVVAAAGIILGRLAVRFLSICWSAVRYLGVISYEKKTSERKKNRIVYFFMYCSIYRILCGVSHI